ncbi:MAG: methyltransferase domain-containing protein [Isosphaeraceae bacterium]|nr:methyltransferase domain-containing protein [Isosphaeraceae bacterium]
MSYDKHLATDEFKEWSKSYDRSILQWLIFGPSHRAIIRRIEQDAGRDRPIRILDVGCGTGVFAERIREAFPKAEVWGVDLVSAMLEKGAERWRAHRGHVVPIQGDSERLPFQSSSFDFVTCANSFHHYPHQDRAVAEMKRVLTPGGRLLLIDGYRDGLWGRFIFDVCVTLREGNVHHCSLARFRDLFAAAGLVDVEQDVHRGPAPFVLNIARRPPVASALPAPHFAVSSRTARV